MRILVNKSQPIFEGGFPYENDIAMLNLGFIIIIPVLYQLMLDACRGVCYCDMLLPADARNYLYLQEAIYILPTRTLVYVLEIQ